MWDNHCLIIFVRHYTLNNRCEIGLFKVLYSKRREDAFHVLKTEKFINKYNLTVLTMIETITVSSRGQIVIPERVREELSILEGMKLILIEDEDRIILEKEDHFLKKIKEHEERRAWIALGESAFTKVWDNAKDEKAWKKYI